MNRLNDELMPIVTRYIPDPKVIAIPEKTHKIVNIFWSTAFDSGREGRVSRPSNEMEMHSEFLKSFSPKISLYFLVSFGLRVTSKYWGHR